MTAAGRQRPLASGNLPGPRLCPEDAVRTCSRERVTSNPSSPPSVLRTKMPEALIRGSGRLGAAHCRLRQKLEAPEPAGPRTPSRSSRARGGAFWGSRDGSAGQVSAARLCDEGRGGAYPGTSSSAVGHSWDNSGQLTTALDCTTALIYLLQLSATCCGSSSGARLKIPWPKGRGGSTPPPGTKAA